MAIHPLSADTIQFMDGGAAGLIIDAAIREAVQDIDDRAEDGKPRYVDIRICFERREDGKVESSVEAAAKLPRRRTASTVSRLKRSQKGSELLFQENDNGDPDQTTIDQFARNNPKGDS